MYMYIYTYPHVFIYAENIFIEEICIHVSIYIHTHMPTQALNFSLELL